MAGYTMVSVPKQGPNAGRTNGKKSYVIIFDFADVDKFSRDENGISMKEFTFKSTKKPIAVYATNSSIKCYHTVEGEDDARGFIHHVEFDHPGTNEKIDEFLNSCVNARLGAIVVPCGSATPRIAGTPCQPLAISDAQSQDDKEGCKSSIKMASVLRGDVLGYIDLAKIPKTDNEDINTELGLTAAAAVMASVMSDGV